LVLNQLTCLVQPDGNNFVQWGVEVAEPQSPRRKRDSAWSFRSARSRESDEKESAYCLRCQSVADESGNRAHSGSVSENSGAPLNVEVVAPLSVSFVAPLRRPSANVLQDMGQLAPHERAWNDVIVRNEDNDFEDLERQYLGKYC